MNKVNINKFRKRFTKTAQGKISLLHVKVFSMLWQYVVPGYYSMLI